MADEYSENDFPWAVSSDDFPEADTVGCEVDRESEQSPKYEYATGFKFITVYEVDRIYGGPEEGGWYYDAGQVVLCRQVAESDVETVKATLETEYPVGTGRNACYSVLYCGGDYRVCVSNEPGADYPEVTPHYE